jgi:cysteine sulfinate desulfinase/cysteine desulfurase-like protein
MGFSDDRSRASLRFSFGRFNKRSEVPRALDIVQGIVGKLRRVAVAA